MTLFYIFLAMAILVGMAALFSEARIAIARRQGTLPRKGTATIDDVVRLARAGRSALAVRLYREITGDRTKGAKQAVENLVRRGGDVP